MHPRLWPCLASGTWYWSRGGEHLLLDQDCRITVIVTAVCVHHVRLVLCKVQTCQLTWSDLLSSDHSPKYGAWPAMLRSSQWRSKRVTARHIQFLIAFKIQSCREMCILIGWPVRLNIAQLDKWNRAFCAQWNVAWSAYMTAAESHSKEGEQLHVAMSSDWTTQSGVLFSTRSLLPLSQALSLFSLYFNPSPGFFFSDLSGVHEGELRDAHGREGRQHPAWSSHPHPDPHPCLPGPQEVPQGSQCLPHHSAYGQDVESKVGGGGWRKREGEREGGRERERECVCVAASGVNESLLCVCEWVSVSELVISV